VSEEGAEYGPTARDGVPKWGVGALRERVVRRGNGAAIVGKLYFLRGGGCGSWVPRCRYGVPDERGRELLEAMSMEVVYHPCTDTLLVILCDSFAVPRATSTSPVSSLIIASGETYFPLAVLEKSKRVTETPRVKSRIME